ncbi:MAG: DUF975 family protein, partial [Oscillospiraceae bacterium]|nr:DUF975 family protein [Oscillospiraceae bacterium]
KAQIKHDYWKPVLVSLLMSVTTLTGYFTFTYTNNLKGFTTNAESMFDYINSAVILGACVASLLSFVALFLFKIFVEDVLYAGGARFFLKRRKNQPVDLNELISNFKDKTYINMAKINGVKYVSLFLWSLLFIIPGIVKSYEYFAINYILAVRPDISKDEAFRISKSVMRGHKMELFVLHLSFYGWFLLSAFVPFGLLSILYVKPYLTLAEVEFMCAVRQKAIFDGVISPFDFPDYEEYNPPMPNFNSSFNSDVDTQKIDLNPINRGFDDSLENNGVDNTSHDFSNAPYTPTQTEVDFKDTE